MPVFRWGNPVAAIRDLEREMDRWLRGMDLAIEGLKLGRPYPAMNLYEQDEAFVITAELPGCEGNDVEVEVANGTMTLRGQGSKHDGDDVPEDKYRRRERAHGPWERSIALPGRIEEDAILAEMSNGLLKLTLPKAPETTPRKIRVASDASETKASET